MKIELTEAELKALNDLFILATQYISVDDEPQLVSLQKKLFKS